MPVREGKLSCSSCHNPHGSISNVKNLKTGSSVSELCISCHTEMRGPVLWEHAPVRENCATCHDPHGSSNDRMLVVRMPMLCQRCHVATRHPATLYDKDEITTNKSNRMFGRSCVNCHFQHSRLEPSVRAVLHAVALESYMRRFVLVSLTLSLGLAIPMVARAQAPVRTGQAARRPGQANAAGRLLQRRLPPLQRFEAPHSLFDQTWRQFQFGGRVTSIDGDPARFQRYQDVRDGVLFTDARYANESPEGDYQFRAAADNVGYRDQRYFADYERTGRFKVSGLWDEIPQFYSVDTATPYTHTGDNLVLDDATQQAAQNGGGLNVWLSKSPQFDLRERRDIGSVKFVATPTPQLDVTASYTMNRHVGELPWGASFGFGNDVEVPLPYDSRTNDFTIGAQWNNTRNMLSVAYNGSWFDNLDTPLIWDSPLRLTDTTAPLDAAACRSGPPTLPRR
jgi:predicted CXXCH cytochrome family protein